MLLVPRFAGEVPESEGNTQQTFFAILAHVPCTPVTHHFLFAIFAHAPCAHTTKYAAEFLRTRRALTSRAMQLSMSRSCQAATHRAPATPDVAADLVRGNSQPATQTLFGLQAWLCAVAQQVLFEYVDSAVPPPRSAASAV
jgi:hypothetical protein